MTNEHRALLNQTFSTVLEQLAFMFVEVSTEASPTVDNAGFVRTRMSFQGPVCGDMELIVPRNMCEELAANIMGTEPDDEAVLRAPFDALKELLNVTCGHVLTALAGQEPVFERSIPTVEQCDPGEWATFRNRDDTLFVLVDEYPVLLYLNYGPRK